MRKFLFLFALILISNSAFALPPANDILIRDRDGEYLSINDNGSMIIGN